MSAAAIREYVRICSLAEREPDEGEFLMLAYFGIIPKWIEEL